MKKKRYRKWKCHLKTSGFDFWFNFFGKSDLFGSTGTGMLLMMIILWCGKYIQSRWNHRFWRWDPTLFLYRIYTYMFSNRFISGRTDGWTGGWNLDGYEIDSNARVSQFSFSFSLSYFSITFLFFSKKIVFFLYLFLYFFCGGGR